MAAATATAAAAAAAAAAEEEEEEEEEEEVQAKPSRTCSPFPPAVPVLRRCCSPLPAKDRSPATRSPQLSAAAAGCGGGGRAPGGIGDTHHTHTHQTTATFVGAPHWGPAVE